MNTLTMTKETAEILQYIQDWGGGYSAWYVGIASKPKQRLFNDHNVPEKGSAGWIFRTCNSSQEAREVEQYFLSLGCDGGDGGGDYDTKSVYAYKKTSQTRE